MTSPSSAKLDTVFYVFDDSNACIGFVEQQRDGRWIAIAAMGD